MVGDHLSPHPTDRLIRELVRIGRQASADEIVQVVERMATAPFESRAIRARGPEHGLSYGGRRLGSHDDSLFVHLVRRVLVDRQWFPGTTAEQYLADLRAAVREPTGRIVVYGRRGGHLVAALATTASVLPRSRQGEASLPWMAVVYSADWGIIVTGYQVSAPEAVALPEDARWLKL